jgi:hypothetical protein
VTNGVANMEDVFQRGEIVDVTQFGADLLTKLPHNGVVT